MWVRVPGDEELEALRARLAETERAMQRIVGQLAKRDAVLHRAGSGWGSRLFMTNSNSKMPIDPGILGPLSFETLLLNKLVCG